MCFDKHCHVQIRVMYEGVFVAKCIKAHVDWSIKNLKVRTHAPHTRARAHARAHAHTHIARACTQAYGHSNDDPWFRDLEEMLTTGLTPQERVDNVVLAFEICRVRRGFPGKGGGWIPPTLPLKLDSRLSNLKEERPSATKTPSLTPNLRNSFSCYGNMGPKCATVCPQMPPLPPAQMPVSYFQVCGRSCRQSLSVIPKALSGL